VPTVCKLDRSPVYASLANYSTRLSANRSEATLSMINHDMQHDKESTSSIDRRLSEIHKSILETKHAVLSQPEIFPRMFQFSSYDRQLQAITARPSFPWHSPKDYSGSPMYLLSSTSQDIVYLTEMKASTTENYKQEELDRDDQTYVALRSQNSFVTCEPTSSFERSSNFFPETFTTEQRIYPSSLIVTSAKEAHSSTRSKTNCYRFLYLKSPRQWFTLNISIQICSSSKYWAATRLTREERLFTPGFTSLSSECLLPQSLLDKIRAYLLADSDQSATANVRLCLSPEEVLHKYKAQVPEMPLQSLVITKESSNMAESILEFLSDLGCQQIIESEVFQIGLISPPTRFASLIHGILVYEIKFLGDFLRHKDLYDIQTLRGMDGIPGFCKLVGIVVDQSKKHLKSYLIAFPQTKWNFIGNIVMDSTGVSWERRENLARQVIEGVRQLHSKSLVIGNLWRNRLPIIVDIFDRVHFWTFDKQFVPYTSRSCCYPPEYAHLRHSPHATNETEFSHITPKADIFLLGMMLWYLAMGYPRPGIHRGLLGETLQSIVPFELQKGDEGVVLPSLPENVPRYYRDIVDACRSAHPNDRPSAWKILKQFPQRNYDERPRDEIFGLETVDVGFNSIKIAFETRCWCSHCLNGVKESYFHCNICTDGDFDICLDCYYKGRHCYDSSHLIVQLIEVESGWTMSKKYHPAARSSVAREVIEL
jgi:hypothetical protein